MKTFHGQRLGGLNGVVSVDGKPLMLRAHISDEQPREFDWGRGSRATCRQHLAIAILAECLDDETARNGHKSFQFSIVDDLPRKDWSLTERDVERWYYQWKIDRSSLSPVSTETEDSDHKAQNLVVPENLEQRNSVMNRDYITTHDRKYPLGVAALFLLTALGALPLFYFRQFALGSLTALAASALLACLVFYCPYCQRYFSLRYSHRRGKELQGWRCAHCERWTHSIQD